MRGEPALPPGPWPLALRKRCVITGSDNNGPLDGYGLGVMTPDLVAGSRSKRVPFIWQALAARRVTGKSSVT